jgi:hypothetical protein
MVNQEKYVVVPDLHGHDELLRAAHGHYGDDVGYVVVGDVFDGTDRIKQTMDILKDIDSLLLLGNHEWVTMAAVFERDATLRRVWQDDIWRPHGGGYQRGTLESYGVSLKGEARSRASRLGNMLFKAGHMEMLIDAPLFFEDEDIVAVHAGVTNRHWSQQRQTLLAQARKKAMGCYDTEPEQLFSHELARSNAERTCLSGKTLVTGHSSLAMGAEQRVTADGRRVRLGSRVHAGAPLYVWENWTRQISAIKAA